GSGPGGDSKRAQRGGTTPMIATATIRAANDHELSSQLPYSTNEATPTFGTERVARPKNGDSLAFERLQARDAGGIAQIKLAEVRQPLERLQAGDAGGAEKPEPTEVRELLERLQASDACGIAQIKLAELGQPLERLQARDAAL